MNISIDLKYLESETDILLARQVDWAGTRSYFGWTWFVSAGLLTLLLIYRWFINPSKG